MADTTDDTTATPQAPISLRAYAKRRASAGLPGCSPEAVSKAVKTGRLRDSVVLVDGEPKIADPELADREWVERSAPRILQRSPAPASSPEADDQHTAAPPTAVTAPLPRPQGQLIALPGGRGNDHAPRTPPQRGDGGGDGDGDGDGDQGESYQAARERKERAAADREEVNAALAAIDLAERRKQVCLVSDFKLKLIGTFTACRSKLATLPAIARSRDPSLTLAQVALLESLVREVLDELAGGA